MLVIGLTGGIGSGKSAVAKIFAEDFNTPIIDADNIAKQLAETPQVLEQIRAQLGAEFFQQDRLLRSKLRQAIFSDKELRNKLEAIIHPLVYKEIQQQLTIIEKNTTIAYCIVVIPLLLETQRTEFIDRILVADCTIEQQIQRTTQRDHCDDEQVKAIIDAQIDRQKRLQLADDIIENHGTIESLKNKVAMLDKQYNLINKN